jgi:DNA segregation ATPase FtsK/SpoIIIE, S-DNA-T family
MTAATRPRKEAMARSQPKKNGHKPKEKPSAQPLLDPHAKKELLVIFCLALAAVFFLALIDMAGKVGQGINASLAALFGLDKYLVPVIIMAYAGHVAWPEKFVFKTPARLGLFLFLVSWGGFFNLVFYPSTESMLVIGNLSAAGGYVGLMLSYPLMATTGYWAGLIILLCLMLVSLVLTFNVSLHAVIMKFSAWRQSNWPLFGRPGAGQTEAGVVGGEEQPEFKKRTIHVGGLTEGETKGEATVALAGEKPERPKKKAPRLMPIPVDLLDNRVAKPTAGDINGRMMTIQKTLENFGIPVEMGEVSVGPTVTQFTLRPAEGIKLSRITALNNDLAMALAAHPIRIEAPIPGKALVGIEVPNQTVAVVGLREVLESKQFGGRRTNLTICLGKDVSGRPWVADLGKMPHLLVAGATGSGKTVCLNTIILSLLFQNGPDDLKLMLIDPKRVELPVYNGIPHLLCPAITEVPKIINALKWALGEMDRRFELLSQTGHRDIGAYNEVAPEKLPYIVILVDELADLMVASASEVEASIIRLAQMARAVGIHLVVATQRPSVDIITGLIKANITTRIAFSVASATDSRTILDTSGAEKLVGRGDMLFMTPEISKPKRIQCCFVGDADITKVVGHIMSQMAEPADYDDGVTETAQKHGYDFGYSEDGSDELLDEAQATVVKAGKASASYLQRRLKIGYARAARLLDLLEERGIIGPGDGAKPRQILVSAVNDVDGMHVTDADDETEIEDENGPSNEEK